MDPHSFSLPDPDPVGKIEEKNRKNARKLVPVPYRISSNLKLNFDQLHAFLLLNNLFCLFQLQKTL